MNASSGHNRDEDDLVETHPNDDDWEFTPPPLENSYRAWAVRGLALLCACSLSVGSHYGRDFLGPLKSRLNRELGTSNTEFSLLMAAYSLNNTWTPLIGGLAAAYLGTALSSIIATSLILLGQSILLLGDLIGSIRLMAAGLFIFGLGVSPLAVVQETIIVRFFAKHGLGVSLAFGLLAGKGASFLSAATSYPLSESYGPHAPFVVATFLAAFSFCVNLVYLAAARWLAEGAGVPLEEAEMVAEGENGKRARMRPRIGRMTDTEAMDIVVKKKRVRIKDVIKLGDMFWAYIAINLVAGAIWSPFTHLAANIIQIRYSETEATATQQASFLYAGSIILYPIIGYVTDRLKRGPIVHLLFITSSALTFLCYVWLALPPQLTGSALPGVILFGAGQGSATLLLVIIVPRIVPLRYVSTALGTHKSIENTGTTIAQTFSGLLLDKKRLKAIIPVTPPPSPSPRSLPSSLFQAIKSRAPTSDVQTSIQYLLLAFLFMNGVQLLGTLGLWKLDIGRRSKDNTAAVASGYEPLAAIDEAGTAPRDSIDENGITADNHDARLQPSDERHVPLRRISSESPLLVRQESPALSSPSSSPSSIHTPLPSTSRAFSRKPESDAASSNVLLATEAEQRRGKMFAVMAGGVVLFSWAFFLGTVIVDLGREKGSGGT